MKILFVSDLHLDHWADAGLDPLAAVPQSTWDQVEALFIVGDLTNAPEVGWPRVFNHVGRYVPLDRVTVTPGNHDYYKFCLDGDDRLAAIATEAGVTFAQKAEILLGGCRILCCTLWTDFALTGERETARGMAMSEAGWRMNDYRYIRIGNEDFRRATPADTARVHADHRAWLEDRLAQPFDGPTIVATHHAPHADCLVPPLSRVDAAYASDLSDLIMAHAPAAWIYGHTHTPRAFSVGQTRLRNVSLGYPYQVPDAEIATQLLQGLAEVENGRFALTSTDGRSVDPEAET